jgi:hypothetical protein
MKLPFNGAWLKWKTNGVDYALRKNKNDTVTFTFDRITRTLGSYKQELYNNARAIRDYYSGTFDVLYSGGIDSEVILRVFKELNIKHNTIVVKYKNDYNVREIEYAIASLTSLNIPYKIIDFDLKRFYENEAYDLCIKSSCLRVGRVNHLKFCLDFCDNIPVMGEGDIYWYRNGGIDYSNPPNWKFLMSEASHNCGMYLTNIGRENVCDFYEFTPYLIKAYNQQPLMQQLLTDKIPGKLSNWSSKWLMHRELWPDLLQRPKLTGLERYEAPGTMPEFVKTLQDVIIHQLGEGNDYWYSSEELDQMF